MKKLIALTSVILLSGSIIAHAENAQVALDVTSKATLLKTEKVTNSPEFNMEQVSYIIGYEMGKGFKSQDIELNVKKLNAGLKIGLAGNKPKLSDKESKEIMQAFQMGMIQKAQVQMKARGEFNQKASNALMTYIANMPNVKKASDGIYYQIIIQGNGEVPSKNDTVTVKYTGSTPAADFNKDFKASSAKLDKGELLGKVFDSSDKTSQPMTFPLSQVISCWTETLSKIPVGSTFILYCAPKQAYGEMAPAEIGPNEVLSFKVELINIKKAEKALVTDDAEVDI